MVRFGGEVIHGDGVGKKFGFPTANLDISIQKTGLAAGVYATYAFLNKKKYQAALAIQEKLEKVEVHLLDYAGPDFYGEYLEVEPLRRVSGMESCETREELIAKIKKDVEKIMTKFQDTRYK